MFGLGVHVGGVLPAKAPAHPPLPQTTCPALLAKDGCARPGLGLDVGRVAPEEGTHTRPKEEEDVHDDADQDPHVPVEAHNALEGEDRRVVVRVQRVTDQACPTVGEEDRRAIERDPHVTEQPQHDIEAKQQATGEAEDVQPRGLTSEGPPRWPPVLPPVSTAHGLPQAPRTAPKRLAENGRP